MTADRLDSTILERGGELIKHETVMHRRSSGDTPNGVYYEPLRNFEEEQVPGVYLTYDLFNDFGCPETITVGIRKGDQLQD